MYNINTDGLLAYLATMLRLVNGALKLDPLVFETFFAHGHAGWLSFWIVFVAGVSLMVGQSIVLFANQVKPSRFAISIVLGALEFVLKVIVIVLVVWGLANFLGQKTWSLGPLARGIGLAAAPYWLSFLVLIPYAGLVWERFLKIYVFLALLVALQAIFGLGFWGALAGGLAAVGLAHLISTALSQVLTPLADQLTDRLVGPEELESTHEIYELFARRNQIGS